MITKRLAAMLMGCVSTGCVPLTFSHDEALDFGAYETAYLEVLVTDAAFYYGGENARRYLLRKLRESSGFKSVVIDPEQEVDVNLRVQISLTEVVISTDDGLDFEYESLASFTATDAVGRVVDSGSVADSGPYPSEAVEDALDEVALHYLSPYRL